MAIMLNWHRIIPAENVGEDSRFFDLLPTYIFKPVYAEAFKPVSASMWQSVAPVDH